MTVSAFLGISVWLLGAMLIHRSGTCSLLLATAFWSQLACCRSLGSGVSLLVAIDLRCCIDKAYRKTLYRWFSTCMAVTTALVFHVHGGDDRQKCKAVNTALVFRAHSAEANVGWVIGFLVLVDLIVSQRHGGIWAHG